MCVGHPKNHPCQHTSVTYNHCVSAHFDPTTGLTTPCYNTSYAAPVDTEQRCTNQLCFFDDLGGSWICCQCGNGPNLVGWCTFNRPRSERNAITGEMEQLKRCDHCCCWNCKGSEDGIQGGSSQGQSSKYKKHHGSSKQGGSSKRGGSSSKGGTEYQWIAMDYGTNNGSSSHKKGKQKKK